MNGLRKTGLIFLIIPCVITVLSLNQEKPDLKLGVQ